MSPSIPVIMICCPTHHNVHISAFLIPYYHSGIFYPATDLYWLVLSGIHETDLSRIDGRLRCIMQGSGGSRGLFNLRRSRSESDQIWDVTDLERTGGLIGPIACRPTHNSICPPWNTYISLSESLRLLPLSFLTAFPSSPRKWTLPPAIANQGNDRRALSDSIKFYFPFLHVSQRICTFFPAASPTQFPVHDMTFQYCKQAGCPLRSGRAKYLTLCPVGPDIVAPDRSRMTGCLHGR